MNHIDLEQLMEQLGKEKIDSILLEGGGTLNWAALNAGIVQKDLWWNNSEDPGRRNWCRSTGSGIFD